MKILVVEDDFYKREDITRFLKKKNIEVEICEYLNDAIIFIHSKVNEISGIILDLGLSRSKTDLEYSSYMGLELAEEVDRIKLNIPILINSTTSVDMLSIYSSVYGHRTELDDYEILEEFITFLQKREEQ